MKIQTLLTAIIAFCAVFTSLGLMFNILLGPVKESQVNLEKRMDKMENSIDTMESSIDKMETSINDINQKLDKILANKTSTKRSPANQE